MVYNSHHVSTKPSDAAAAQKKETNCSFHTLSGSRGKCSSKEACEFNNVTIFRSKGGNSLLPEETNDKGRCSKTTSIQNYSKILGSALSSQFKSYLQSHMDCLCVGVKAGFLQGLTNCRMSMTCAGDVLT